MPAYTCSLNRAFILCQLMMHNVGKEPLCNLQKEKAQISMCICAVWSEHHMFVDIYYSIHWFCKRTTKALISLHIRACVVCKLHKGHFHALYIKCSPYPTYPLKRALPTFFFFIQGKLTDNNVSRWNIYLKYFLQNKVCDLIRLSPLVTNLYECQILFSWKRFQNVMCWKLLPPR